MSSNLQIGRGWPVFSADRRRVGDVTEVHPHYILVSRGVILVKDMYLPLGTVDRVENSTVVLTVNYDVLRRMDVAHEPPVPVAPPEPAVEYSNTSPRSLTSDSFSDYPSEAASDSEPLAFPGAWNREEEEFEETPSYNRPLPNGLLEVEHALNLAYSDLGYGMPTVLMQGWPFDSTIWEPLPYELALYNRTVTYDVRGSGDSDKPWDFYAVQTLSQDLHRLIVEQSLRDVTLVAWSTAAVVALTYAQEHPKRVERLVLISPLIPGWITAEDAQEWLGDRSTLDIPDFAAWQSGMLRRRPAVFEEILDRLTATPLEQGRRAWMLSRLMHGAHHAQLKLFDSYLLEDPVQTLQHVKAPVTILHAVQDRIAPLAMAERLASLLPGATLLRLEDCGHAPFLDQPERIAKLVGDLVSSYTEPSFEPTGTMESEESIIQTADEDPVPASATSEDSLLSGEPVKVPPDLEGE